MSSRRRTVVLAVLLLLSGGLVAPAAAGRVLAAPPEGAIPDLAALGWVPVLNEDFNGTALDRSLWTVTEGPGTSGPGWNTPDAVRVSGGELSVTVHTIDTNGSAPGGIEHRTGEIRTGRMSGNEGDWTGFQATFGYVEARVKLSSGPATRSAFWTLSPSWHRAPWGDPAGAGPEIDIFEITNSATGDQHPADGKCDWQLVQLPCDQIATGTLHSGGFDEDHTVGQQQVPWLGPSPQGNYLTYGLLWTPDGHRMYRNGIEVFRGTEAITYQPEYLILSLHQGGVLDDGNDVPAGGYGSLSTSTAKMIVDYVRVWQRPISEIPDQTVVANAPVAVPFSVTDHLSTGPSGSVATQPGSVRVTATSSNQAVLPNARIAVTGNGSAAPSGSTRNTGFEPDLTGWTVSGAASRWTTRKRSGAGALRLTQGGGRAEQTITGLRPNTTYVAGGFVNLELGFTDTNGNGRYDTGEPLPSGDGTAAVDIGVSDVDASRTGEQTVRSSRSRNAWQEADKWWSPRDDVWREQRLTFTTGPATTQVKFFIDNAVYAGRADDSDLSFDDMYIRPLVAPNRTVTARPADNAVGSTTVTLTARNAANQVLGTESFTLTFTGGSSFTNGDFESVPIGARWELLDGAPGRGADIVVDNPFRRNHVLELAGPANEPDVASRATGTAFQRVTGLRPGSAYTLTVTGKGGLAFGVQEHAGPGTQVDASIATPDWSTKSITFTTGATNTTANVFVLDWDPANVSYVDNVRLTPVSTAGATMPPLVAPALTALAEQRIISSAPHAVSFTAPANTTITSVTSDNPALLPDPDLAATTTALSLTPVPDRTGRANLTVAYSVSGVAQTPKRIPVVVSDRHLVNAGFEQGGYGWAGATVVGGGAQRTGAGALRLDGSAVATTHLTGLPYNTGFVLNGWVRGTVRVTIRRIAGPELRQGNGLGNPHPGYGWEDLVMDWTGSTWTQRQARFTTAACQDCHSAGSYVRVGSGTSSKIVSVLGGEVQIVLSDANPTDGQPAFVDDLSLVHVPTLSPLRELSLHQGQTPFAWDTRRTFDTGRIPANGLWNPSVATRSSSDQTVLPTANVRLANHNESREYEWTIETAPGVKTGRSTVTVQLTDPATGQSTQRSATVTVNAGNSFHNGDFQRGVGNWAHAWLNDSWQVVDKQRWRHLGPNDKDQVLRISSGIIGYRITGLTPNTGYVVRGSAIGDGSKLEVRSHNPTCTNPGCDAVFGTVRGTASINSASWAPTPDLRFTTAANETEVWLFVVDADLVDGPDPDTDVDPDDAVPASATPCAGDYAPGETCLDDIGIFKAADVGLL